MSTVDIDVINPVELSQRLIRCPSVTPHEGGALDELQSVLEGIGFHCQRLLFRRRERLTSITCMPGWAICDQFLFRGHSDVVPPGDRDGWGEDPFSGVIIDGKLFGRGSSDMKSAIASFVSAAHRYILKVDEELLVQLVY